MARVLVVEDEPGILEIESEALRDAGHQVLTATDGREALKQLAHDPHLIVLDMQMPSMDGRDFLEELRRSSDRSIPVLVVSGLTNEAWSRSIGADGFLGKPFLLDEFCAAAQRLIAT